MAGYYDPNMDYSLAIKQAKDNGASAAEISRLQAERQNKIDDKYGGTDPYKGSSNIMGSGSSAPKSSGSSSRKVYEDTSEVTKGAGYVTGGYTPGATYGTPILGDNPYWSSGVGASRADMSRRPDLAGSYAVSNGYTVFYDENGYATKAVKGVVDYSPHQDMNVVNGTYNTSGAWTDNEVLTAEDRQRIQAIRAQMQAGQITGDQANQLANQIRSSYGYTIDKNGNVTDLGALSTVDSRRQQWGLPTNGVSAEQQNFLQMMYPEQQTTDPAALLAAQYALAQGTYDPKTQYTAPAAQQLSAQGPSAGYVAASLGGNYSSGGSYAGGDDLSEYLREMYAQNIAAELAALNATYEQNVADIRAQDDLISATYDKQRNLAAAQNDIQRMQMNEFGIMRGLNSGASGQMALAQSAAYQSGLAQLGSQEAQSLADNALTLTKLTAQYKNAADQAAAQGNAQLASALYDEYVRQQQMAWQAQQAAQEQANWERQFAYQQMLDQQNYNLTLQQLAAKNFEQGSTGSNASSAGGGKAAQRSSQSSGYNNGGLTTAQIKELQAYYGTTADGMWGANSQKAAGGLTAQAAWSAYQKNNSEARSSFHFDEDEGIFSWNGKTYNSMGNLLTDMERAGLSSAEKAVLEKKMKLFGIDIAFD